MFEYQSGDFIKVVIPGSTGALMGLFIAGFGCFKFFEGGWIMVPLGTVVAYFCCIVIHHFYHRTRPIIISEQCIISISLFGKKYIKWPAVEQIEKLRINTHTDTGWRYGFEIIIHSKDEYIIFSDKIKDYTKLISQINKISKNNNLKMLFRDRGEDTKKTILNNSIGFSARRQILKKEVVAKISEI